MNKILPFLFFLCFAQISKAQTQLIKTVDCTAGSLSSLLNQSEKITVTDLIIKGKIDARDFKTMKFMPWITNIDLSASSIVVYSGSEGPTSDSYTSYDANVVPGNSFLLCQWLKTVILPSGVKEIGPAAFSTCQKLVSISIPEGANTIKNEAFYGCNSLPSIEIPSTITSIEDYAFNNCTAAINVHNDNANYSSLEGVLFDKAKKILIKCPVSKKGEYLIPSSVLTIGSNAFRNCDNLTSVTIPSSVTSIDVNAFSEIDCINSIVIPSSVISIVPYAFYIFNGSINVEENNPNYSSIDGVLYNKDNTKLIQSPTSVSENFVVPNTVTYIEGDAFNSCKKLTSVTIPSSVKYIGPQTFMNCTNLTSVSVFWTTPINLYGSLYYSWEGINCTLKVPYSTKGLYSSASGWMDFKTIIEMEGLFPSTNKLNFSSNAKTKKIFIASSTSWTATSDKDWLSVSPASGTGNDSISITVTRNTGESRSGNISFSPIGYNNQNIEVVQDKNTSTDAETVFNEENYFKIFPNPNNGQFSIDMKWFNNNASLSIFNLNGVCVYSSQLQNKSNQKINLSGIEQGIYFLKVNNGKEQLIQKMIVEH